MARISGREYLAKIIATLAGNNSSGTGDTYYLRELNRLLDDSYPPITRLIYPSSAFKSPTLWVVSKVVVEFKDANDIQNGYLINIDDVCCLLAYNNTQRVTIYDLNPKKDSYKIIKCDLTVEQVRRTVSDAVLVAGSGDMPEPSGVNINALGQLNSFNEVPVYNGESTLMVVPTATTTLDISDQMGKLFRIQLTDATQTTLTITIPDDVLYLDTDSGDSLKINSYTNHELELQGLGDGSYSQYKLGEPSAIVIDLRDDIAKLRFVSNDI